MTNSLSLENEGSLFRYFSMFTIPMSVRIQIVRQISHAVKCRGVEDTVLYLKSLKQQRLLYSNGQKDTFVRSHKDLTPYGPMRYLWRRCSLSEALNILNVYTCAISDQVTKKQRNKFLEGINTPEVNHHFRFKTEEVNKTNTLLGLKYPKWTYWTSSKTKRAPFVESIGKLSTKPETHFLFHDIITEPAISSAGTRMLMLTYSRLFAKSLNIPERSFITMARVPVDSPSFEDGIPKVMVQPIAGKIGLIQERGLKLRSVANPFRIFQHVLTPLGDYIYHMLEHLDWDCTFDQSKAGPFVTKSLQEGKTLYAFDLSSATDKFPLSIQLDLISKLIKATKCPLQGLRNTETAEDITIKDMTESIEVFKHLSRACWYTELFRSNNVHRNFVKWTQGQPLGLFPSFGLFALSHGLLVRTLEKNLGLNNCFRILGDDIIITNQDLAQSYKESVLSLGCEISESKTLISNMFGEFAGKLYTKDGEIFQPKWQPFSDKNPLGPIRTHGYKGFSFVPVKYRKSLKLVASLPRPIGLEINPLGICLQDRVDTVFKQMWKKNTVKNPIQPNAFLNHRDTQYSYDLMSTQPLVTYNDSKLYVHGLRESASSMFVQNVGRMREDHLYIEHFNAYISGLQPWEFPTIETPKENEFRSVNRSIFSKVYLMLGTCFKFARNLKQRQTKDQT